MNRVFSYLSDYAERTRRSLADARALPLLSLLAVGIGTVVGGLVTVFRLLIEQSQSWFLPGADPENYEGLLWIERLLLATSGGVILGILFFLVSRKPIRVGVVHVMERLAYHEGHLPFKHAVMQFIGGAISIICGHSVGREGPSIHLGAAAASITGQWLQLPNNSIRILVACGASAAIAASFNTPLAGVIFVMEVIMMEYSILGFTPVILATVSATVITRLVFDSQPTFLVPQLELVSLWELPTIIVMGIVIGGLAAGFIVLLKWITKGTQMWPFWLRMSMAGAGVGLCAFFVPEVMGIGYDTVNLALLGEVAIASALLILVFKLLATAISVGLGLPAGLIGPSLFIGAMAGSATGLLMTAFSNEVAPPGLYTMLGMGAMMGATLQAPLAALLALLELTGNERIIFPAMLAIVSATLAAKELFGQGSVYLSQMQGIGLDYRNDPVAQSLRRLSVSSIMNESFFQVKADINREQAEKLLVDVNPHWLIINREQGNLLMPAADLARYIEETDEEMIDLLEVPSKRQQLASIYQQATLQQALTTLNDVDVDALTVIRRIGRAPDRIYGIITRQDIEEGYRLRQSKDFY